MARVVLAGGGDLAAAPQPEQGDGTEQPEGGPPALVSPHLVLVRGLGEGCSPAVYDGQPAA